MSQFIRTELLIGEENIEKLSRARVAVFGIGGVGGFVCEALVRCGVGAFDLVDDDKVGESNLNRQIIALHSTIGRYKTEVMHERMKDINPDVSVREHRCFFLPDTADRFPFEEYDYIVDCIDTVTAKLELISRAKTAGVPIICAMGTGNKLDPSLFKIADISKTKVCPLARIMRKELNKRGIKNVKVLYSEEDPTRPETNIANGENDDGGHVTKGRRDIPGSISFVPASAGLLIASQVVKDLLEK